MAWAAISHPVGVGISPALGHHSTEKPRSPKSNPTLRSNCVPLDVVLIANTLVCRCLSLSVDYGLFIASRMWALRQPRVSDQTSRSWKGGIAGSRTGVSSPSTLPSFIGFSLTFRHRYARSFRHWTSLAHAFVGRSRGSCGAQANARRHYCRFEGRSGVIGGRRAPALGGVPTIEEARGATLLPGRSLLGLRPPPGRTVEAA